MLYKYLPYLLTFTLSLLLAATLTAGATGSDSAPSPINLAPASAPSFQLDTLPPGRYEISSYNNGRSMHFRVENRQIQELAIDGKTIPATEYAQHEDRIAGILMGGNKDYDAGNIHLDMVGTADRLERQADGMERYFEAQGEKWEQIGEDIGEMVEEMFDFDEETGTMRFGRDSFDTYHFEFNLDSMLLSLPDMDNPAFRGGYLDGEGQSLEDVLREKEREFERHEAELEELGTMIEALQRERAEAMRSAEDMKDDFSGEEFDFERELVQLRREGRIPQQTIKSYVFSNRYLKVNGRKVEPETYQLFLERYRAKVNIGDRFNIQHKGVSW